MCGPLGTQLNTRFWAFEADQRCLVEYICIHIHIVSSLWIDRTRALHSDHSRYLSKQLNTQIRHGCIIRLTVGVNQTASLSISSLLDAPNECVLVRISAKNIVRQSQQQGSDTHLPNHSDCRPHNSIGIRRNSPTSTDADPLFAPETVCFDQLLQFALHKGPFSKNTK